MWGCRLKASFWKKKDFTDKYFSKHFSRKPLIIEDNLDSINSKQHFCAEQESMASQRKADGCSCLTGKRNYVSLHL